MSVDVSRLAPYKQNQLQIPAYCTLMVLHQHHLVPEERLQCVSLVRFAAAVRLFVFNPSFDPVVKPVQAVTAAEGTSV